MPKKVQKHAPWGTAWIERGIRSSPGRSASEGKTTAMATKTAPARPSLSDLSTSTTVIPSATPPRTPTAFSGSGTRPRSQAAPRSAYLPEELVEAKEVMDAHLCDSTDDESENEFVCM